MSIWYIQMFWLYPFEKCDSLFKHAIAFEVVCSDRSRRDHLCNPRDTDTVCMNQLLMVEIEFY
jgi:hypothetical protein